MLLVLVLCPAVTADTGSGESDVFTVDNREPVITLLAPAGGEVFDPNTPITITWTSQGIVGDARVGFSSDAGETFTDVKTVTDSNSCVWTVPPVDSNQCVIRVLSSVHESVFGICGRPFSIVMPHIEPVPEPNEVVPDANSQAPPVVDVNTVTEEPNAVTVITPPEPNVVQVVPDPVVVEPNVAATEPNKTVIIPGPVKVESNEPNTVVPEPNTAVTVVEPNVTGTQSDVSPPSLQMGGKPDPNAMIAIPAGSFEMGDHFGAWDADERPVHTVHISALLVGATEVTNRQYCEYLNEALGDKQVAVQEGIVCGTRRNEPYCNVREFDSWTQISFSRGHFVVSPGKEHHPMLEVSWFGAAAYCNWLSERQGLRPCYNMDTWESDFSANGYRLPTEAEWEYSARGGLEGNKYPWGNDEEPTKTNWWGSGDPFEKDPYPRTTPVGFYPPNGYGLYDMAGNVWEWCNDWYGLSYYGFKVKNDPRGPASGSSRVTRGGSWILNPDRSRCSNRNFNYPHYRGLGLGFRVVRRSD